MNKMMKRIAAITLASTAICGSFGVAYAVEKDIGATAMFRQALALTNLVNMNYGYIDYSAAAANDIDLAPDSGAITCSNTVDYTCPSTGTAGSADISGTTGQTVQISCRTSGVVSDGTNQFNLTQTKIRVGGTTTNCAGLGTSPVNHTLAAGTNQIKIGARLVIPSAGVRAPGTYTTANSGGSPITLRVVYQ